MATALFLGGFAIGTFIPLNKTFIGRLIEISNTVVEVSSFISVYKNLYVLKIHQTIKSV